MSSGRFLLMLCGHLSGGFSIWLHLYDVGGADCCEDFRVWLISGKWS